MPSSARACSVAWAWASRSRSASGPRPKAADGGEGEVVGDRGLHHQALLAAVLGDEGEALGDALGRGAGQRLAGEGGGAGGEGVEAEEGAGELAAARAHQAEEAEDLAGADVEGDVLHHAGLGEAAGLEDDLGGRRGGAVGEEAGEVAADHRADHPRDGEVGGGAGVDEAAVAEDGDGVAELRHVAEDVADVDEGAALGLEPRHHVEEPRGLARGERGRRLVEDDEVGGAVQRLGDLDELALAGGELADDGVGGVVEVEALEQRAGGLGDRLAVDQAEAAREAVDEDVLGDREVGEEVELLVDEGDAAAGGVGRGRRRVGLAAPASCSPRTGRRRRRPCSSASTCRRRSRRSGRGWRPPGRRG